jgi:hypothetical protein
MKKFNFDDWYLIYKMEIDNITNQFLDFIMTHFSSDDKYHSLNIQEFTNKIKHLIYNSSYNTEKHSILYL